MTGTKASRYPPLVSRREAARRLGVSTWTLNKYTAQLDVVEQHGVNVAGEQFTREMLTLESVERLRDTLAGDKRAA